MQDRIMKIRERRRSVDIISAEGNEVNRINIELFYNAGGINYATYKHEERGYWLSVQPELFSDHGRFTSTQSKAFSGVKQLIEPANRFGKAKLAKIVIEQSLIDSLVNYVCEKNNIIITKPSIAA